MPPTHAGDGGLVGDASGIPGFEPLDLDEADIVLVDDERTSLTFLSAAVTRVGYPVRAFSDPLEAMRSIRERPPHVLMTDMIMKGMSGVDLALETQRVDPDVEVVLVSAVGDQQTAVGALGLGISSYLSKPVEIEDVSRALHDALVSRGVKAYRRRMVNSMYAAMAENEAKIREVTLSTLETLMNALDARSPYFKGHSRAVAMQAAAVAQALGLGDEDIEAIRTAGLLHDVGMIAVPDSIVDKPDALTEEERELVRQHCWTGARILGPMKHLGPSVVYILDHHERWDGSGYPNGKQGDEISLGGQIVGITETWTAMIESRAYRAGRSHEEGFETLRAHQGEWFTEELVDALIESDVGVMG